MGRAFAPLILAAALPLAPSALARQEPDPAALVRAIEANDVDAARHALSAPSPSHLVNARLAFGETPLARAVETQDVNIVALLLGHKADANATDALGRSPLSLACEHGTDAIVSSLLKAGADARRAAPDGASPLAVCARFAPASTVTSLLTHGASPDVADSEGMTPLMWAASAGKSEAVAILLQAGAQADRVTPAGFTPLLFAVRAGDADCVHALLAAGASLAPRGPENSSALQLALYQKHWPVARALLPLLPPADLADALAEVDRNGHRPLHVAAQSGDLPLLAALLDRGADPNGLTGPSRITWVTEANFGMPPPPVPPTPALLVAARAGEAAAMKLLIERGANASFIAQDGTGLLLAAASSRNPAALDLALSLAPDANVADAKGRRPLHLVLQGGAHPELAAMLSALARHGARTDLADARGTTPAKLAADSVTDVKVVFDRVFAQTSLARTTKSTS